MPLVRVFVLFFLFRLLQRRLRKPLDDVDDFLDRLDDDGLNVAAILETCSGQDNACKDRQLEVHPSLSLRLHLRLEAGIRLQRLAVKVEVSVQTLDRCVLDELHLVNAPRAVL